MLPIRDENPTSVTPWITVLLIVANIATFFALQPDRTQAVEESIRFDLEYAAIPCEITTGEPLSVDEVRATYVRGDAQACDRDEGSGNQQVFPDKRIYLAVVVSMFLHGGLLHLGGNMLFLWIFGNNIEDHLGALRFLLFYVVGGLVAAAGHVAVAPDSTVPVIGASGAVAAAMGAYLVWFPEAPIRTLVFVFFPVDLRAKWVLGIWFVSQFFIAPDAGVAWMAHVAGFVFGVVVGLIVRLNDRARRAVWHRSSAGWSPLEWDTTGGAGRGPYPRRWPYVDGDPTHWRYDDRAARRFGGRRW